MARFVGRLVVHENRELLSGLIASIAFAREAIAERAPQDQNAIACAVGCRPAPPSE
jgi:hypothetical protein